MSNTPKYQVLPSGEITDGERVLTQQEVVAKLISLEEGTPSSHWAEKGEPDPHGDTDHYRGERSQLVMGHLTDDQMANAVYLTPSIANLTGAKERIRWLSRALEHQIELCEINGTGRD